MAEIFSADEEGRSLSSPIIKNPSVVTAAGIAIDLTFFGRYPAANYLTDGDPNTATPLRRSTDGGMDHGADRPGMTKLLAGFTAFSSTAGAAPMTGWLLDYLMYYPLIPMEDVQVMVNATPLPRYADAGGWIMLVEQFPYVGGGTCRVTYTNQDGVSGRQSAIVTINTQIALGTVATSAPASPGRPGIFVPLQSGDSWARAIESIEFFAADAGNLAAVIVRPLAPFGTYETTCPMEWDYPRDFEWFCVVEPDAYVSAVVTPSGSLSGAIIEASLKTIWITAP